MKLYDAIIRETEDILRERSCRRYPPDPSRIWKDLGMSELIMLRDAAFELGGSGHSSVNYTCVTTTPGLIPADEIVVCGPDLPDIRKDVPFARIILLETDDLQEQTDTEKAYRNIRDIEYIRYHVFPAGYMVRVSSTTNEEQVRVSKKVHNAGIRFPYVGGTYIRKYHSLPLVRHARVIFVTDPGAVDTLVPYADRVDGITKTLTHILDGLPTDCGHCSMKAVCDEVEGMREMHLGKRA